MDHRFPPAKRLTQPAQFAAVMQQGKRRYEGALAVHVQLRKHLAAPASGAPLGVELRGAEPQGAAPQGGEAAAKTPMDRAFPANSPARLGLVVGKKLARTSVERNRIKRQAREVFRQTALPTGCDVVVRLAKPAKTICNAQLRASLQALMAPLAAPRGPHHAPA
jgi:ribonuclease P protein component